METHDKDLIRQFKKGSVPAFTAIYDSEYAGVFYFARKLTDDEVAAADITSESFYKLWKLHQNFDNLQSIRAFLKVTTRNACFNYLRDLKHRNNANKEVIYLLSQNKDDEIEKDEIDLLLIKRIYNAIEALPSKCKGIFKMAYIEGLKNGEIAERLKISDQAVRNAKTRALKILRGVIHIDKDLLLVVAVGVSWLLTSWFSINATHVCYHNVIYFLPFLY